MTQKAYESTKAALFDFHQRHMITDAELNKGLMALIKLRTREVSP